MNGNSKGLVGVYVTGTPISSIYHGLKLVWGKTALAPVNPYTGSVAFEVDTQFGNTLYFPIIPSHRYTSNTVYAEGVINWGDGKTTNYSKSTNQTEAARRISHTYQTDGKYIVVFTPSTKHYEISDSDWTKNYTNPITKFLSYGDTEGVMIGFYYPNYISYLAPNSSFESCYISQSNHAGTVNLDSLFSKGTKAGSFQYNKASRIEGDMFRGNNIKSVGSVLFHNENLKYIESLNIATATSASNIIGQSPVVIIETVAMPTTLSNMAKILDSNYSSDSSLIGELREMEITNISSNTNTYIYFDGLTNWGVNSDEAPNARMSLVKSLLDNTTDKSSAVRLYRSTNSKDALTDEEIAQITSKGYTIL